MFDTHCHLTNDRFAEDVDAVITRAVTAGVDRMLIIGTGVDDAEAGAVLAGRHPGRVLRAAGLDPFTCHEHHDAFDRELARLAVHLRTGGCVALGEVGLEFHHHLLPAAQQERCLLAQLELAIHLDLPVILHVRDGHAQLLALLNGRSPVRGCIHSYSADADTARAYLDLGLHLAFNGMVTFKRNETLREALRIVPEDRLLLETDAPYLAPEPHRGLRCEPAHVSTICHLAARVRTVGADHLDAITTRNAVSLFRLGGCPGSA